MDLPADRSRSTSALPAHPSLREAVRSPQRRRPTGAAPPLPYRLQTSGVGWLVAAVVLVGLTLAIFGRGLRGPAVTATVIDDALVGWLAGLVGPGMAPALRGVARIGSWWVLYTLYYGLVLALLVLRRWRHAIVWWALCGSGPSLRSAWQRSPGATAVRGRAPGRLGWLGAAVGAGRVPDRDLHGGAVHAGAGGPLAQHRQVGGSRSGGGGRHRQGRAGHRRPHRRAGRGGYRGDHPLLAFRRFTPNEVYPVVYQRGRSAHLDIGGARGQAIRRALEDQLGLLV
jgi:hypothetical protein